MRGRWLGIALLLTGCSLLVNPRADNEYDLVDGGTQAPDGGERDGSAERDGGVDAGPVIPAAPVLRFPWNGFMTGSVHTGALPTERNALRPRFVWEPSGGAERYEVQLSAACEAQTREACTFDGAIEGVSSESEWRPEEALPVSLTAPVGRRYVWRARACNVAGCSRWTPVRYLDVGRQPSDFNGDGYADVLVGAPGEARVYVANGPELALGATDVVLGPGWLAASAMSTVPASVGDVNADGFADAVIGAPSVEIEEGALRAAGAVVVCLGSVFGLDCEATGRHSSRAVEFGRFGWAVAAAGDMNGDGFGDVAVGARGERDDSSIATGAVHVFWGGASGLTDANILASAFPQDGGRLGYALAGASDADGDGYPDLVVGAPGENGGGTNLAGRAHLWLGGPEALASEPSRTFVSAAAADEGAFGGEVAIEDLDGDGLAEIVIAAPGESSFAGALYRVDGSRVVPTSATPLGLPVEVTAGLGVGSLLTTARDPRTGRGILVTGSLQTAPTLSATLFALAVSGAGALEPRGSWTLPIVTEGNPVAIVGDVGGDGRLTMARFAASASGTMNAGAVAIHTLDESALEPSSLLESPSPTVNGAFGEAIGDRSASRREF